MGRRSHVGSKQGVQALGGQVPAYCDLELLWLEHHWGGEEKFLSRHGFNTRLDSHRASGRMFCRQIMKTERQREEKFERLDSKPINGIMINTDKVDDQWWKLYADMGSYIPKERRWIQANYRGPVPGEGGEYYFLRQHNLSISSWQDRAKGRMITRIKRRIQAEKQRLEQVEQQAVADVLQKGLPASRTPKHLPVAPRALRVAHARLRAARAKSTPYQKAIPPRGLYNDEACLDDAWPPILPQNSDGSLNPGELEWVQCHYGSEFNFLAQFELKLHNEEDRAEGRRKIRQLMAGSSAKW